MLTNSLWKAFSGISVAQKGIDVTSSNITNANTPGYTKKTANQISQVLNPWQGGEVAIANITRTIDAALQKQLRGSLSDLGSAQAVNDILQRADTLFGNTTANSDLTAQLTKLSTLLQSVALQPNDATHNTNFIMTAQAVLRQINSAETSLQELRKDADARLDASVDELNAALDKISLLNKKILAATADGKPSGDLEDQRDIEIETVAKKLDIVIMPRDRNGIAVYTKSGYMLFDQEVRRLAYTPTSTVDATTRYDLGGFSGITIPASSIPTDLTSTLRNGELKGLVDLRDNQLPAISDQLNTLVKVLNDTLNALHNTGTAYPPPQTLTGTQQVNGSDTFIATGTLRIAVTTPTGILKDYIDLDLNTVVPQTVQGLVDTMNAPTTTTVIGGALVPFNTLATASITNGRLTLTANAGSSIAVGSVTGLPTPTESMTGKNLGVSHYFGLNDLFDSALNQVNPPLLVSNTSISSNTPFVGTGLVRINLTQPSGAVISSFDLDLAAAPAVATVGDIVTKINAAAIGVTASITSSGKLLLKDNSGQAAVTVTLLSPPATETASGKNFISYFDFKDPRHLSAIMDVRSTLVTQPKLLARGQLTDAIFTPPLSVTNPPSAITAGDARLANLLARSFTQKTTIGAAEGLSEIQGTLLDYSALFLSNNAQKISNADDTFKTVKGLNDTVKNQFSSVSSVDVQEEMLNLTVFQNAYNAAGQAIKVTNQMLDALEQIFA